MVRRSSIRGSAPRLARTAGHGWTSPVENPGAPSPDRRFSRPLEQFYGFSIGVCLPDGMSHQPSRATGTVMRPPVFEGYAREAGFSRVEVLPLEHDLFQIYRLEP